MKKGFTLIELLAVIVILAIIALIAVPIVLNIINESKESSLLRSAEFYLDAVEYAVADAYLYHGGLKNWEYPITPEGDICKKELPCDDDHILKVEVNGEKPTSGYIEIIDGNIGDIEIELDEKTIVKDTDGTLIYQEVTVFEKGKFSSICKIVSDSTVIGTNAGAKYSCKVDPNKDPYIFYVLTTPRATDTSINLIMNANINASGEAVIPGETSDKGSVYWTSSYLNTGGPVDAMQFLYNATKDWTNIDPITYEYKDKDYQETADSGYISFISIDGIATITSLSGTTTTIGTSDVPLRARMPIYSATYTSDDWTNKIIEKGEVADKKADNTNSYLYDNLDLDIDNILGYWTLSSYAYNSDVVWFVGYDGAVDSVSVEYLVSNGVRPVINLKL